MLVFSRLPARAIRSRGVRATEIIYARISCAWIETFYQAEPLRQREDLLRSPGRIGWSGVADGQKAPSFHRQSGPGAARADAQVGSTSFTPIFVDALKPHEVTLQS